MVKMKSKKGFIRTLEAVIAIIILLSFIYVITPKIRLDNEKPNIIEQAHVAIFSEVLFNNEFRDCITNKITTEGALNNAEGTYLGTTVTTQCASDINSFIEIHRPNGYVYLAEVCNKAESCLDEDLPVDKSVYVESVMLASSNSKLFRVYFWER